MTSKCKCGGRRVRTDILLTYGRDDKGVVRQMWTDTDKEKANWKCNRCGQTSSQRKRQPAGGRE